jgi:hypothetical protein
MYVSKGESIMSFYERFEDLCRSRGLSPQSKEILEMLKVSSPSVTGWKEGATGYDCRQH